MQQPSWLPDKAGSYMQQPLWLPALAGRSSFAGRRKPQRRLHLPDERSELVFPRRVEQRQSVRGFRQALLVADAGIELQQPAIRLHRGCLRGIDPLSQRIFEMVERAVVVLLSEIHLGET